MNPEENHSQLEGVEQSIERADKPKTFLDKIRKWARDKALLATAVVGVSGVSGLAACDLPTEKDKTEQNNQNNQNEIYQGCEPFERCQMVELKDRDYGNVVGFSLWYDVPDGEEFDDVKLEVVDVGGETIGEEKVFLPEGTGEYWITEPGYEGDMITEKASIVSHVNIIFPDETIVTIKNGALLHPDNDGPSLGN